MPRSNKIVIVTALSVMQPIDEYFIMSNCQGNAKIGVYWRLQGAIAGDHFYHKRERNIVLQLE